jgi:hypothetical protein
VGGPVRRRKIIERAFRAPGFVDQRGLFFFDFVALVAPGAASVEAWSGSDDDFADSTAGVAGVAGSAGVAAVAGVAEVPADGSAGVAGVAGDAGVAGVAPPGVEAG